MKNTDIVWYFAKGGVPPPPGLVLFPFFYCNFSEDLFCVKMTYLLRNGFCMIWEALILPNEKNENYLLHFETSSASQ